MLDSAPPDHGLPRHTVERIHAIFAAHAQIEQVILYGSRAKGNYRTGSDIDLVIRGPALTLSQMLEIENALDDLLLPYKIDLSLLHKIDHPELLAHIDRVGIVFFP